MPRKIGRAQGSPTPFHLKIAAGQGGGRGGVVWGVFAETHTFVGDVAAHGLVGLSDKDEVEDLTKEFIAESEEGLDRMERCLTTLEVRPDDPELLGEIFRAVHSIKGTTGFLGFERLEALAHAGESLLGLVRDGRVEVTGELVSGLLELLDGLRRILRLIDETGGEGKRTGDDDRALIEMLRRLSVAKGSSAKLQRTLVPSDEEEWAHGFRMNRANDVVGSGPEPGGENRSLGEVPASVPSDLDDSLELDKGSDDGVRYAGADGAAASERTLRVDVEVLNRMMNLVGELVLTRNQIMQSSLDAQGFAQLGRRLNTVTAELRETVMQARMQPVGHVFSKFPRLVRDLAKTCRKKVRIEFAGQETGLDKSLLEAIKDPLTHAVRNAVDHGIEEPEARLAAGKQDEGVLRLRAFHQGGAVVIELSDDGAGIAVERVRAKAVERKLVTRERAAAMSETDVMQMVFLPGFSTAEAVTNVSGRGVGMDVVRSNVEKVGGSVELATRRGRGTTLRLRVPLTLAIVPALVVVSGGQSFAVPQSTLVELVYVGRDEVRGAVERMGEAELYRLRGSLLPIVRLDHMLGIDSATDEAGGDGEDGIGFYLAVLDVDGCRFGLMLDDLLAPEEIVVKPLSLALREIGVFSGATVLGNGTLALILDVAAIAGRAGVSGQMAEAKKELNELEMEKEETRGERFLLFRFTQAEDAEKIAIALEQVERIERVAVSSVEYVGGRPVLQYQGRPLLLQDPEGVLDSSTEATVLIGRQASGSGGAGLVVAEVFHVVTGTLLPPSNGMPGVRLALLDGKLTAVHEVRGTDYEYSVSWEETSVAA